MDTVFDFLGEFAGMAPVNTLEGSSAPAVPTQRLAAFPPNAIPRERLQEAMLQAQARRHASRMQHPEAQPQLMHTQRPQPDELERLIESQRPVRPTFPVTLNSASWKPPKVECVICLESFAPESRNRLLCGHAHCDDCIKANAHSALGSNPFSPAKCCYVIPREILGRAGAFTSEETKSYMNKMEELTNPHYKLYCWGAECGTFIPMARQKKRIGECEECGRKTCKACRQKSHFGACDREKMQELQNSEELVYKLAESKGWKRCPNCLNIVQKHGGCNHMSCKCGQGFCYACGQAFSGEAHICAKDQAQNADLD